MTCHHMPISDNMNFATSCMGHLWKLQVACRTAVALRKRVLLHKGQTVPLKVIGSGCGPAYHGESPDMHTTDSV